MIPFFPMAEMLAVMRPQLDEAFSRVLANGQLILGREVEAFEEEFAAYCGARHCVGVGNGLDALAIALRAHGVGPGDEVVVPGHTFIASWMAVSQIGAVPVPADVDPVSLNLSPDSVAAAVTPRTAAIMPVHLYGNPAPMDDIGAIAERHHLLVVEDAAQAHGARYRSRRAGSLGHSAGFSFYPTKNLGALGDGGAVVTNDDSVAARARRMRNYGAYGKYIYGVGGRNSRLDELQAAFLRARLRQLDQDNARRREIASLYIDGLSGIGGLSLPYSESDVESVYHLFVVRAPHRDKLGVGLAVRGVGTMVHYPRPPHLQPMFSAYRACNLPTTAALADEVLSLPMSPVLNDADIGRVIAAVRSEVLRES